MPGIVQPPSQQQHHHRSTTKTSHKPFKPRFTSKNALKDRAKGKVESLSGTALGGSRKTRHQEVMSKFDRRNQAKQRRLHKRAEHLHATGIFQGKDGAPRIVAVVPLCDDVSAAGAVAQLNKSLDLEQEVAASGVTLASIDRFKQKLQYVVVAKDMLAAMDACQLADYVLFVVSATKEVDSVGEAILRCVEGQGISSVYAAVQGLEQIEAPKKRAQVLVSLKSFVTHFFPALERLYSLDAPQECQNIMRSLCTTLPRGIKWREERSWMLVEDVAWTDTGAETATALATGTVRGKNLQANRLVQLGNWGDFQVGQILAAPRESVKRSKSGDMAVEMADTRVLDAPTGQQETLDQLAPEEAVMEDVAAVRSIAPSERRGVLLDDEQYESEHDSDEELTRPKRLPRGTSNYQSAWYLGDVSDSGSDMEDVDDDYEDMAVDNEDDAPDAVPVVGAEPTEGDATDYQSEMFVDAAPDERELAAFRARKQDEAGEDFEFPDEIELEPNVLARERLARYRALRSLKTSPWVTDEDAPYEPADWQRLLEVRDWRAARAAVLREALVGGAVPGTRVQIEIKGVPLKALQAYTSGQPLALVSLLRHERKQTAVDASIILPSDGAAIKAKAELVVQIGWRRFAAQPLFSQGGSTPNDVHKYERFLHPGRTAVASFVAPATWGPVPVLYFEQASKGQADMEVDSKTAAPPLKLVAHGTALPTAQSRVIAKRVVLTGQPYKIHKRVATVRYMFFNREDIEYFRAAPLFTNHGRGGAIREPLGTHGYYKASIEGSAVGMMDSIGMALYKRMWPRAAERWAGVA